MTDSATIVLSPESGFEIKGTGGIPNLRIVQDFASDPPTLAFELHAQIELPRTSPEELRDAIRSDFPRSLVDFLMQRGTIHQELKGPFAELLMRLYKVRKK